MTTYEYRVVPAPQKGAKAKGVKTPEARFANTLQGLMNDMGAEGWEYMRADTLPSVERSGLTGSTTEWRHVLVFRKATESAAQVVSTPTVAVAPAPVVSTPEDADETAEVSTAHTSERTDAEMQEEHDPDRPAGGVGATQMLSDNGVEETSEVSGMTNSLQSLAAKRGLKTED